MSVRPRALRAGLPALLLGLVLTVLPGGWAAAEPTRPEPGRPWFGPALLYPGDDPASYVDRLGETPAMYTLPVPYPLDGGAISQLQQFSALVAEQGAALLLDVQPGDDLRRADRAVAAELASELDSVHDELGIRVLVRFAPEMNGSWEPWGQQPGAYVRAFRTLADQVHEADADAEWASMVWAPVYGSGYPFRDPRRTQGALDDVIGRDRARLDTNDDGRVDLGDDPYSPYYPGDEWVDWVGLSMYRLGQAQGVRRNTLPPPTEFRQRLEEGWGYPDGAGGQSFYDRYATGRDRPMLVETAAFYNPAYAGPSERTVKSAWWRQVFGALDDYPQIAGISWLDVDRSEPEALQDEPVDWRVTHRPGIARAFREALVASPVTLGPVTEPVSPKPAAPEPEQPEDPGPAAPVGPGHDLAEPADRPALATAEGLPVPWWVLGSTVLLLVGLLLGWAVPRWHSPAGDAREGRLDLVRGGLLLGLLAAAMAVPGVDVVRGLDPWLLTAGTGLLLLVSGASHGVRAREIATTFGGWAAGLTRLRRARTVYVVALAAAALALLLENAPGVASSLGEYEHPRELLGYPPPMDAVADLVTLTAAPWLAGTLLHVAVLVVVAPVFLALTRRGAWWAALGLSWALYAAGTWLGGDVLSLGTGLPLLLWQLPFVHGLVLGHHRTEVAALARRGWPLALPVAVAATYAVLVVAGALPDTRPPMPVVVGLSAAALLAVTTGAWRPLRALLGWLLLPVGRAPLVAVPLAVALVTTSEAWLAPTGEAQRWAAVVASVAALWLACSARELLRSSSTPLQPTARRGFPRRLPGR